MKITFIVSDLDNKIHLVQANINQTKHIDVESHWERFVWDNKDINPDFLMMSLIGAVKGLINWIPDVSAKDDEQKDIRRDLMRARINWATKRNVK